MKDAVVQHILGVFPIFGGLESPGLLIWKSVVFGFCYVLNKVNPKKYVWSVACVFGIIPAAILGMDHEIDPIALFVRFYLIWMCAEVTFQSASSEPEARIRGWWLLALVLLVCL